MISSGMIEMMKVDLLKPIKELSILEGVVVVFGTMCAICATYLVCTRLHFGFYAMAGMVLFLFIGVCGAAYLEGITIEEPGDENDG